MGLIGPSILGINNGPAHVVATVDAGHMRRRRGATFRAGLQLLGRKSIVRATFTGARIGMFAFRNGHDRRSQQEVVEGLSVEKCGPLSVAWAVGGCQWEGKESGAEKPMFSGEVLKCKIERILWPVVNHHYVF